jgi:hypothetical protein
MTKAIEDVGSLTGREVLDQQEEPIGEVKAIYATEAGFPMWVAVEASLGMIGKEMVWVPLARLKEEDDDIIAPYSKQHILDAPKPEDEDTISAECDRELRIYYGIGTSDQEMWEDHRGYVTMVPEEFGEAKKVDDPDDLDTPDPDKRTEETNERARDPGSSELRDVDAQDVFEQSGASEEDNS